jgi:hypothetical protein
MAGRRVTVESELSIGRENTDLTIEDPEVSRRHAVVRPSGNDVEIEDQGSTNGTFVNDRRIEGTTKLAEGDVVKVGNTTLEVERAAASAETVVIQRPPAQTVIAPAGAEAPAEAGSAAPGAQQEWRPPSPPESEAGYGPPTQEEPAPSRAPAGGHLAGPRTSRARWLLIGGGIVAALLVAFLLYNFFFKPPSKEDYIAQADAICERGKRDLNQLASEAGGGQRNARRGALRISRGMLADLKDLERPEEDAETLDSFFAAFGDFNAAFRRIVRKGNVQRRDQQRLSRAVRRLDRSAKEFGFEECRATGA